MEKPPGNPADHAEQFATDWADRFEEYCTVRMAELGIPDDKNGERDPNLPNVWRSFVSHERTGGHTSQGITVNSGCLNPELLKRRKGGRIWQKARLRDRIDAIIAHEWAESLTTDHHKALKAAAKTKLAVSSEARQILEAMAR
jgi:hypothetical protein